MHGARVRAQHRGVPGAGAAAGGVSRATAAGPTATVSAQLETVPPGPLARLCERRAGAARTNQTVWQAGHRYLLDCDRWIK